MEHLDERTEMEKIDCEGLVQMKTTMVSVVVVVVAVVVAVVHESKVGVVVVVEQDVQLHRETTTRAPMVFDWDLPLGTVWVLYHLLETATAKA